MAYVDKVSECCKELMEDQVCGWCVGEGCKHCSDSGRQHKVICGACGQHEGAIYPEGELTNDST